MPSSRNEGEGDKTAAPAYNEPARKHVKQHDVKAEAQEAKRAFEGPEGQKLRGAEALGKSHAKEEEPAVRKKPTRS